MKTKTKLDKFDDVFDVAMRKSHLPGQDVGLAADAKFLREATVWIGTISGIFGYGMSVVADTEAGCREALRTEFKRWMAMPANQSLKTFRHFESFDKAFEYFGGRIERIQKGVVHYDDFGS